MLSRKESGHLPKKEWFKLYHQDSMGAARASGTIPVYTIGGSVPDRRVEVSPGLRPGAGLSAQLPLKLAQ